MNRQSGLQHFELFINGQHAKPSSNEYSLYIDPATEEPIAAVALGSQADVDIAVTAARAALNVWGGIRAADRGRILQKAAQLIEEHSEGLVQIERRDAGKQLASVRR